MCAGYVIDTRLSTLEKSAELKLILIKWIFLGGCFPTLFVQSWFDLSYTLIQLSVILLYEKMLNGYQELNVISNDL